MIGPWPLKRWLSEVAALEPSIKGKYVFVDADHLLASTGGAARLAGAKRRVNDEDGPLKSSAQEERSAQALHTVRRMLRVASVSTVPVKHCYKVSCSCRHLTAAINESGLTPLCAAPSCPHFLPASTSRSVCAST